MKKTQAVVLSMIIMVLLGSVYTWSVFRIPVEEYYQVNNFLSGLPYMISLVFYALSMVITGRYLSFKRMKIIAYIGVFFILIGWVGAGISYSIVGLILTYGVFIGTGVGILYGIPIMIIQSTFKSNSGFYTGLVLSGFGLSPLITAPLIKTLLSNISLHHTFIFMGILSFLFIAFLTWRLNRMDLKADLNDTSRFKFALDRPFIYLYILLALGTSIGLMMIGLSFQIGVQYYGFRASKVTIAMTLFGLSNGLSRILFGYLSDRFRLVTLILLPIWIMIICGVIAFVNQGQNYFLYLLSYAGFWFVLGSWLAIAPNAITKIYGLNNYSKGYGILFTTYGLGAIIGVTLSGLILDVLKTSRSLYQIIIFIGFISIVILSMSKLSKIKQVKISVD